LLDPIVLTSHTTNAVSNYQHDDVFLIFHSAVTLQTVFGLLTSSFAVMLMWKFCKTVFMFKVGFLNKFGIFQHRVILRIGLNGVTCQVVSLLLKRFFISAVEDYLSKNNLDTPGRTKRNFSTAVFVLQIKRKCWIFQNLTMFALLYM